MATIEELKKLYKEGKYREIIAAEDVENLWNYIRLKPASALIVEDDEKMLQIGWAFHQLGEYDKAIRIMELYQGLALPTSEFGESAWRGLAHGLLQRDGDITGADKIMKGIPPSLNRDNVRMNMMIMAAREGLTMPAGSVMSMIANAMETMPYATVNGHIINNGALVLHEARQQEGVKPYLPILPGLIDIAIGIYEATDTAKNHIASAEYRAAQICRANGWLKLARISAETSVELWRELVNTQDGARYKQNLEGAEKLLREI